MPLVRGTSLNDCISKNIGIETKAGKGTSQARAIALSHCNGIWGGASKKKDKKNETDYDREVDTLKKEVQKQLDDLLDISSVLSSIKEVLNFKRTGKVYPDEGVLSAK